MKLSEIKKNRKTIFSFEVFPPKKTSPIETVYNTVSELKPFNPDFISVTFGAGGGIGDNSTCKIASTIKNDYGIEPIAHLACVNLSKPEVKTVLKQLEEAGIENVLALRGDRSPTIPPKEDFHYACELINLIRENSSMEIAAACYPETHPEALSPEADIRHLKEKVDAGATHLISQLFFDNHDFIDFLYRVRSAGINVPVEAGIMPVINKKQISRMVSLCGASLPKKFTKMMNLCGDDPQAMFDAGIAYASEQIIDLISSGVNGIHLYTMNNPKVASRICLNVQSIINCVNN
jgi:methylenetetrahydrofolate reductase (NADPH)